MKNKYIIKTRKKLDVLDNSLLAVIKKRTKLVDKILKQKTSKNQVVDKKRIRIVLSNIKRKAKKRGIDSELAKNIWKGMIQSYINYEFKKFKKKKNKLFTVCGNFFSIKISCFLVEGLYFFNFNLTFAFSLGFFT